MKSNNLIRIMCLMLIVVMISSIFVGTTLSRFSDTVESIDSTRVAIWDINANEVTMNLFDTFYIDENTGNTLASSYNNENIIAPGTSGTSQFSIINHEGNDAPEVLYYIQIDLDDSQVSNDIITNQYIQWKLDNGQWGTWDELKVALYSLSGNSSGIKTYQAGEFADAFKKDVIHSISWRWLEEDIDNNKMSNNSYNAILSIKISASQTVNVYTDVVEGNNQILNINDNIEPLMIKSSAPISEFQEVRINNEIVDPDNYTLTDGSTVVTFKKEYLEKLELGVYTVSIVSENQIASTKIDIVDRVSLFSHNNIIPAGGVYQVCATGTDVGDCSSYGAKYVAGDKFPDKIKNGDIYTYGDYKYKFASGYKGWMVKVIDKTKSEYDTILHIINNEKITNMDGTFINCTNLIKAPLIPDSVYMMRSTFYNCSSLKEIENFPNDLYSINGCFENCKSLINVPEIPVSVTNMGATFKNCTSLVNAPVIPKNIEDFGAAFSGCKNLTGTIEIHATNMGMRYYSLHGTKITWISGSISDSLKQSIAEQSGITLIDPNS